MPRATPEADQTREAIQRNVHVVLGAVRKRHGKRYYLVLHRRWIEGQSVAIVAKAMHLTEVAVRQLQLRAQEKFRKIWMDQFGESFGDGDAR